MGCNIVAGEGGDVKDYLQDMAWYCNPLKPESLREALQKAMQASGQSSLRDHVLKNYSWKKAAEETYKAYKKVLDDE
jgi:glycosyltransferase involved in cell wall biosynthesis